MTKRKTPLPVIGVARFEEASKLLEAVIGENVDVFLAAQTQHRDKQRAASSRPLDAHEAAQIASAIHESLESADTFTQTAERLQASELRTHEPPDAMQLLVAGGAATAPQFIEACFRFVALLEMPADEFRDNRKTGTLHEAINDAVTDLRDRDEPMDQARARVKRCMEAFAVAAGRPPGEGLRLLGQTAWQALQTATEIAQAQAMTSSSLTGSAEPTAGPGTTSPTS